MKNFDFKLFLRGAAMVAVAMGIVGFILGTIDKASAETLWTSYRQMSSEINDGTGLHELSRTSNYACVQKYGMKDDSLLLSCVNFLNSCDSDNRSCIAKFENTIPGEDKYVEAVNKSMLRVYYAAEAFKKNPTEGKKCTTDIGAIAYAIARLESGVGASKKSQLSNNWTSLHPGKTYWKWDGKSKTHTSKGEVLRHYSSVDDGLYDFMGLWKSSYGCSTSDKALTVYLNGFSKPTGKRLVHVQNYIKNFRKFVKEYEEVFSK